MNSSKSYIKYLDIIRIVSLIGILLYHFNIIKGGFLFVCTFFVLSGYLSCISALKKEKFLLIDYYKSRFIKIYLPLLIVVFLTIIFVSFNSDILWLNLKPESTSVIAGYNNFWQLSANLDYFARHVDSPFMHFWYIAILLQFELIFPLIFIIFKKLGEKIHKIVPCIILFLLSLASVLYFYKLSISENIMFSYYNSFARAFSLLLGVLLGFIHHYYKPLIFNKIRNTILLKVNMYIYLLLLCALSFIIGFDSNYYNLVMIFFTLVSLRMIDYSALITSENENKILKYISKLSYWIYLLQYPLIYLFQNIIMNNNLKYLIITLIILVLSMLFTFIFEHNGKFKILKGILLSMVLSISLYGVYLFIIAEDHTAEMKELEEALNRSEQQMEERKKEYEAQVKEEKEQWTAILEDFDNGEEKIKDLVSNLSVVGLGDSVMLGAVNNLYSTFKKGYFDAGISRTCYVADDILNKLKKKNALGDVIVFNYGANGDCSLSHKKKLLDIIGDRKLFWLTVTNDKSVHFNSKIKQFASEYNNIYIIDWENISKGHSEYFYSDGIHLTPKGRKAFASAIYEAIYNVYLVEYNARKEEIMNQYNEEMNSKITFFGNGVLINIYDYLKDDFDKSNFITDKSNNYDSIKEALNKEIEEENLNKKVVFIFDKNIKISNEEYNELIDMCSNHEIFVINFKKSINFETNINVINFYEEIDKNPNYLMPDKVHLSKEGNEALKELLVSLLK